MSLNAVRALFLWAALFAFALFGACNDESSDPDAGHHHEHDAGADAAIDEDEDEDVPCTPEYPVYEAGMSMEAGDLTVTLLSASPEPPRQKVANDWVFELADGDGTPLSAASISNADSYMEVHGHYGTRRPKVMDGDEAGQYLFDDIDFRMRGPWEVIFDVQPADGSKQTVRFKICVE